MIAESSVRFSEVESRDNPFPGLRPFDFNENHLFFGRDGQSGELIVKLSKTHFLAVVGTSGSGKSSLVRAGLLPAIYSGMMGKAGSGWRIVVMRPGNDPMGELTRKLTSALTEPDSLQQMGEDNRRLQIKVTLRRGSMGFIEAVRQAHLKPHENLLVVVDQFEELFRFVLLSEEYANDAAAFVKLLLEARHQDNIYIVLTMRSDYLGDCAQFWDLPEAINEGQYLIPRMTREERREAIIGPLGVRGAPVTSGLVNQLLNDMGDSPDQLPILQHALMRIWKEWRAEGDESKQIDLRHYKGGMAQLLSTHADEAYAELPDDRSREIAEKLFKCLTEKGADDRETRRPTELQEICLVVGASKAEVVAVIDVFRREGRSFLMPSEGTPLADHTSIDISHESLIRSWLKLRKWVEEEAESGRVYRRLADDTLFYCQGAFLRGPRLQEALEWRARNNPNEVWASRHHAGFYSLPEFAGKTKKECDKEIFKMATDFLDQSKSEHDKEIREKKKQRRKEIRRAKRSAIGLAIVSLIILALAVYAFIQKDIAVRQAAEINFLTYKASLLTYRSNMNAAREAYDKEDFGEANQWLSSLLPKFGQENLQEDLRGFDWNYLWRASHNERETMRGHSGEVLSVAVSPDGQAIATGSADETVKLWNARTQQELMTIKGDQDAKGNQAAIFVAFASDGKTLVIVSSNNILRLWDTSLGQETKRSKFSGSIRSVAFARNNNRLSIGDKDGSVQVWDINTPEPMKAQGKHSQYVTSVAFSPDGATIVSGSADGTVKLWDANTGQEVATLPTGSESNSILSVAFSPDGAIIAAGTGEGIIKLWDAASRKEKAALGEGAMLSGRASPSILSLAFGDNGTLISGNADGTLKSWDINTAQERRTYKGHAKEVLSVVFFPDGKTIVTGSSDTTAKLWDANAPMERIVLRNYYGTVYSVAFSPRKEDKLIVSGNDNGAVYVWDSSTYLLLRTIKGHNQLVSSVAISADRMIASGSADATVKLWKPDTDEPRTLTGHTAGVQSVAFSPDGKVLASGSADYTTRLWDVATGNLIGTLTGHKGTVWSVAFSTDGKILATGSADHTIKLWKVSTLEEIRTLTDHKDGVLSVAFSPDNKLLASGSIDKTVKLWDVNQDHALTTLSGQNDAILSVTFSPDGKRLATGGGDGSVKLWDTSVWEKERQQELAVLGNGSNEVRSLAFAPDGMMMATGRKYASTELWLAATPDQVASQR